MVVRTFKGFRQLAAVSAKLSRAALVVVPVLMSVGPATAASLFNIAKVQVDVTAKDAVVAREKGMAKAETEAMRTLLGRLVPLSMQSNLPAFSHGEIEGLVAGVAIRSEKTSHRRYVGVLDVRFYPDAVRQFLRSRSIPVVESQASAISILPVMLEDEGVATDASAAWLEAWGRLDLENGVAPARLVAPRAGLDARIVRAVLTGDAEAYAGLRSAYGYGGLVVAVGEEADGLFRIDLAGEDAAGAVRVAATSAVDPDSPQVTKDRAARLGFGTLQRRWQKRLDPRFDEGPSAALRRGSLYPDERAGQQDEGRDEALGRVGAVIEFFTVSDWQRIRFGLQRVEELQGFEVVSRSARSADVVFDFGGSASQLQALLGQNGIALYQREGVLVMRASEP